jgi:uncharacterized membrane protein
VRNLITISAIIEVLSLITWVGGMGSLALIAAPAIFEGASSRENAGRIFGLILKRFHRIGYGCGVAILIAGGLRYYGRFSHSLYAAEVIRYAIAATMLALTLYTGIVIARRLEGLRERMEGGIDRLAKDDPRRVEFNRLHRQSTGITAFSLLLGITMAVLFGMEVY